MNFTNQKAPSSLPVEMAPVPIPKPEQTEPVASVEPARLRPLRTEYFKNDLTPEQKEELINQVVAQTRATLDDDLITVNAVSRMFGVEHNRAKKACAVDTSLLNFYRTRGRSTSVNKLAYAMSKLTEEERQLLLNQLQTR